MKHMEGIFKIVSREGCASLIKNNSQLSFINYYMTEGFPELLPILRLLYKDTHLPLEYKLKFIRDYVPSTLVKNNPFIFNGTSLKEIINHIVGRYFVGTVSDMEYYCGYPIYLKGLYRLDSGVRSLRRCHKEVLYSLSYTMTFDNVTLDIINKNSSIIIDINRNG